MAAGLPPNFPARGEVLRLRQFLGDSLGLGLSPTSVTHYPCNCANCHLSLSVSDLHLYEDDDKASHCSGSSSPTSSFHLEKARTSADVS